MTSVLVPPAPAAMAPGAGARPLRLLWRLLGTAVALLALGITALAALPAVGANLLVVTSGSMEPAIATGDAVVLVDTPSAQIGIGDVITFEGYTGTGLITHRVVSRHDVGGRLHFRTKGDANATADVNLAPADGMVGEVLLVLPQAGRLLLALAGPAARMLLLVVPGAVLAAMQARYLLKSRRRRRPRGLRGRRAARALLGFFGAPCARRRVRFLLTVGLMLGVFLPGAIERAGAVLTDARAITNNTFSTLDLAPPTNVTATFDCGTLGIGPHILVDWDAIGDAQGYEVARATTAGGPYSTIASVDSASTSYADTATESNTTYYYVVRSTAAGWVSENSVEASETVPATSCL